MTRQSEPAMPSMPAESMTEADVSLASIWRHADRTLLWTGAAILACAPFSAVFALVDDRALDGALVWLKPLKFQMSVAVFLFTLALMTPLAGDRFRRGRWGRIVVWVAVGTSVFEIAWITLQAARGERSHYNDDSAFGTAMYAAMGVAAVALAFTPLVVAIASMRHRSVAPASRIVRWGLLLGVLVSLLGGIVVGLMLGSSPDHYPDPAATPDDDGRLALVGWSTTRGDLRIAHFVGLHALQGMLLLGFILARTPERVARITLTLAALGWMAAVILLTLAALKDQAPWTILAIDAGGDGRFAALQMNEQVCPADLADQTDLRITDYRSRPLTERDPVRRVLAVSPQPGSRHINSTRGGT